MIIKINGVEYLIWSQADIDALEERFLIKPTEKEIEDCRFVECEN